MVFFRQLYCKIIKRQDNMKALQLQFAFNRFGPRLKNLLHLYIEQWND